MTIDKTCHFTNSAPVSQTLPELAPAIQSRPLSISRRGLLAGMGALSSAFLVSHAQAETAAKITNPAFAKKEYRLEEAVLVDAARLDRETKKAFPLFNAASVVSDFDAVQQGATNDVVLYRLITSTTVPETGEVLDVTGLLALPRNAKGNLPVVSWQHGTILSFDQVPSNLVKLAASDYQLSDEEDSLETLFNVQRFAGNGFAVVAADYVGKGPLRKGRGEGYSVKGVTTQTCIDILNAGFTALQDMNVTPIKLFLNGWSQGALNTQWLHQALRNDNIPIEATAIASPFNSLPEAWRFWSGRQTFKLPAGVESYPELPAWIALCMIVALGSYELHYGLDGLIESSIRPQYHEMARKYWNDYDASSIDFATFPATVDLFVPDYFDAFTDERNSAFLRQFAANSTSYGHYDSDIRFIYGLVDEAIHPEMVTHPLSAGGKFVKGVPVSGASHRATFLAGLYGDETNLHGHQNTLEWFTSKI